MDVEKRYKIINFLVIVSLPNHIFSLIYSVKSYTLQRNSICNYNENDGNYKLAMCYIVNFVKQFSKRGPWTNSICIWEYTRDAVLWVLP